MDDDDDDEQGDGSHDECNKATEVHGVADVDVPLPHAIGGDHASDHTSSSSSSVASSSASAEPTFKYARVEGTVAQLVLDDALSCVAILGTHGGAVHVLDVVVGQEIRRFHAHMAAVTGVAVEYASEEVVASCADDGTVAIYEVFPQVDGGNGGDDVSQRASASSGNAVNANVKSAAYTAATTTASSSTIATSPVTTATICPASSITSYKRAVKALALDPDYARRNTRQFVCGGMAGELVLRERGWMSTRDVVVQQGEGAIYAVSWHRTFIAWADEVGTHVYDVQSRQHIGSIAIPAHVRRPDIYKCHLCWMRGDTLLIGWGRRICMTHVKERSRLDLTVASASVRYLETSVSIEVDYFIAGIGSYKDGTIVLAYNADEIDPNAPIDDNDDAIRECPRPEIRLLDASFTEVACDMLSIGGYQVCQPSDYSLVTLPEDSTFYVLSPKDLIVGRPRDSTDRVDWLLERDRLEDALGVLEEESSAEGRARFREVGQAHMQRLMDEASFEKLAALCPRLLNDDAALWEQWILAFAQAHALPSLIPFIPVDRPPHLSSTIYELVLATLLTEDPRALHHAIRTWPDSIYNRAHIVAAVEDALAKLPRRSSNPNLDNGSESDNDTQASYHRYLLEAAAELYTREQRMDMALDCLLRLRKPDVFDFITRHRLESQLAARVVLLLDFEEEEEARRRREGAASVAISPKKDGKPHVTSSPSSASSEGFAMRLLLDNIASMPVTDMVERLAKHPAYLCRYLDGLFRRDPTLTVAYHHLQPQLYAVHQPAKLLDFLKISTGYGLEGALRVCEECGLLREQVYLLGRMGNSRKALGLIINKLENVDMAMEFASEQDDPELWDELVTFSLDRPPFLRSLLEHAAGVTTHVNARDVIARVPCGMEVPGLKGALVKIMHDCRLLVTLREGCQSILTTDCMNLLHAYLTDQKRPVSITDDSRCSICREPCLGGTVTLHQRGSNDETDDLRAFWCGHVVHERCLAAAENDDTTASASATASRFENHATVGNRATSLFPGVTSSAVASALTNMTHAASLSSQQRQPLLLSPGSGRPLCPVCHGGASN